MHLEVCMSNVISDPVGLLETFTFTCLYFFLMSISIYYSDKKNVLKPKIFVVIFIHIKVEILCILNMNHYYALLY